MVQLHLMCQLNPCLEKEDFGIVTHILITYYDYSMTPLDHLEVAIGSEYIYKYICKALWEKP